MSAPSTWEDRRGMFQAGKVVHEPGRKMSKQFGDPIAGGAGSILNQTGSPRKSSDMGPPRKSTDLSGGANGSPNRRRSSAASGGLFSNLHDVKRGSQDHGERRASRDEMTGTKPGLVSGWFGQTFKGAQKDGTAK
nr:hypothetical protein B0A51_00159 [Rachicladosporium sp. CCFEE 5018]